MVHALRARGLAEGDTVALMAGNQREALVVTLACLHGGWLVVPVNWHWVADELRYVLDDSDAAALFVAAPWLDVAIDAIRGARELGTSVPPLVVCIGDPTGVGTGGAGDDVVPFDALLTEGAAGELGDQVRGGPMFYTSGTTGFPKGVKGALGQTGGDVAIWQLLVAGIAATIGIEGGVGSASAAGAGDAAGAADPAGAGATRRCSCSADRSITPPSGSSRSRRSWPARRWSCSSASTPRPCCGRSTSTR